MSFCNIFLFFSSIFSIFGTFWDSIFWSTLFWGISVFPFFLISSSSFFLICSCLSFFIWLFISFSVFNCFDDFFFGFSCSFIFELCWFFCSSFGALEFSILFFSSIFCFDWTNFLGSWIWLLMLFVSDFIWFSLVCFLIELSLLLFSFFPPWVCIIFLLSVFCGFSPLFFCSSILEAFCSILFFSIGFVTLCSCAFLLSVFCSLFTFLLFSLIIWLFWSFLFLSSIVWDWCSNFLVSLIICPLFSFIFLFSLIFSFFVSVLFLFLSSPFWPICAPLLLLLFICPFCSILFISSIFFSFCSAVFLFSTFWLVWPFLSSISFPFCSFLFLLSFFDVTILFCSSFFGSFFNLSTLGLSSFLFILFCFWGVCVLGWTIFLLSSFVCGPLTFFSSFLFSLLFISILFCSLFPLLISLFLLFINLWGLFTGFLISSFLFLLLLTLLLSSLCELILLLIFFSSFLFCVLLFLFPSNIEARFFTVDFWFSFVGKGLVWFWGFPPAEDFEFLLIVDWFCGWGFWLMLLLIRGLFFSFCFCGGLFVGGGWLITSGFWPGFIVEGFWLSDGFIGLFWFGGGLFPSFFMRNLFK